MAAYGENPMATVKRFRANGLRLEQAASPPRRRRRCGDQFRLEDESVSPADAAASPLKRPVMFRGGSSGRTAAAHGPK